MIEHVPFKIEGEYVMLNWQKNYTRSTMVSLNMTRENGVEKYEIATEANSL